MNETLANLVRLTDSQLYRLIYSLWDFQQALSALTFLMEECNFDQRYSCIQLRKFRCYETTAIVSFARPFEAGRGETALGLKAVGLRLDNDELALQERILNLRRKIIAHSDEGLMHFRGLMIAPLDDNPLALPYFKFNESLHLSQSDLAPIEALLRKMIDSILKALFALSKESPERLAVYKHPG